MAEVYRAKDTRLGRDVAIKVVSEALGADPVFLERFEREAKLAGSLAHPNVVALHDVGFHDGKPYFVTELLEGESLRERLAKGPIPLATALDWAGQMAQGLAAAHERGIVHRDLKPENVFIAREGHLKLLDFGIAKLVEAAQGATPHSLMDETVSPSGSSTGTGMVLGTPGYMSPEQVRGDPVDLRTDFFSLGAVLYEMLSGHRAFAAGPVVETGYAIIHHEPEPLTTNIPPLVVQVVNRCLEKEAGRRFQSARDLAFNLELVRTPTSSALATATAPVAAAQLSRWRPWLRPVAAFLAVLAAGSTMYFVGRDTRPPPPSVQSLVSRLGRVSAGRFNPDGRVIFSAAWDGRPLELFAQTPGSVEAQSLGFPNTTLLAVSTTGELAVLLRPRFLQAEQGTLAVVPGVGGTPREVAENVAWADWSPTGELAVVRWVGGRQYLEYPLGTVLVDNPVGLRNPRVSPSGNSVAFIDHGDLKVVDRKGQVRTLSSGVDGSNLAWVPNGGEVWFTALGGRAIWAASLRTGERRLVYQGVFEMEVEDISKEGRVLVNALERRWEVAFAPPGKGLDVRLSVFDSHLAAVSDDGRQVLFSSGPAGINLRPTDGGAPLKLGLGTALALSPDAKWVLAVAQADSHDLTLLAVGPDVPRKLAVGDMIVNNARFFYDGNHIAFIGRHPQDKQYHLYKMSLDGGTPAPISDFGVFGFDHFEVSRDDRFIAAHNPDEILTLYPTDGGTPVPLSEFGKNTEAVAWTTEGNLWVRPRRLLELPSRILLYDIRARRVLGERPFSLNDATGVFSVFRSLSTPDGGAVAFDYHRVLGHLYLLDGLAPPLR
jgi:eukaryotic-like serine/threonine-protein kinase